MSEYIRDILDLPDRVRRGDFVLRLSEGVAKPEETLKNYVVTDQLVVCFDQALDLIKTALQAKTSKGCYLHGSFGSGKSHFMAVLDLILGGYPAARSIPELSAVVAKHNNWTEGKKFMLLPYHMIGKENMEAAILGGYVDQIHKLHPGTPAPGLHKADGILRDAEGLRTAMGDAAFFGKLNEGQGTGDDEWGDLSKGWTAESFEHACAAGIRSEERSRLVGALVDRFFSAARNTSDFVDLGDGLSIISKHAKGLGYDAVILFLDELILWLASRAADVQFLSREGQKLANLLEAQTADRPIPLVSFVARQRDLKELVGDRVTGVEYLRFSDSLDWWEARFATIKLTDRNLPAIAEKRVLKPKSEGARQQMAAAFEEAVRMRNEVLSVLLTRDSDRDMFRRIYPFSPAFMDTLVEMSFLLQRERTALKVMLQILIDQKDRLKLGDIVPVGDLFDAIAEGDEAVSDEIKRRFDFAKKLYEEKFRPVLERDHSLRFEELASRPPEDLQANALRNDDRLVKTLLLAALAPNVEALKGVNANRLAALNHGTIRSPIPGREGQIVLTKCRRWATEVGQLKIGEDPVNPSIAIQLSEVDTDSIIDGAKAFDNPGNRIRKIRGLLFKEFGIEDRDDLMLQHSVMWRGTRRTCNVLFQNVRKLPQHSLFCKGEDWQVVIDWPFDEDGRGVADDRAQLGEFMEQNPDGSHAMVILPSFFSMAALRDLGKLVILDNLMRGDNFANHTTSLTPGNRETAKTLLENQRSQLQQRVIVYLANAYGISDSAPEALDTSSLVEGADHFVSLDPSLQLRPPAVANLQQAFADLLDQALQSQYPAHPRFDEDAKLTPALLKRVYVEIEKATQTQDGRVGVERTVRKDVRQVANPLRLGSMEETHFVISHFWKDHFTKKQAETGGALTVENLRCWMDDPEATGLPVILRNLVIMVFAAQTNHTFFLHGSAIEPSFEDLVAETELRTVDLPSEQVWNKALDRAGHLFGVTAPPLVSATSVARFSADVKSVAESCRKACAVQMQTLDQLRSVRKDLNNAAPRMVSAKAACELADAVAGRADRTLVEYLAQWKNPSTDAAVGTSLKKADDVTQAVKRVNWEVIETASQLPEPHRAAALAIVNDVKTALEADEHAVALGGKLRSIEQSAMRLIKDVLQATKPEPPPVMLPPPNRPGPDDVPIAPVTPGAPRPINGQREVRLDQLDEVVSEISTKAKTFKKPKVKITWEIYE
ncbi:MAG TPA: phage resistance protein [Verrucomicrobia bacterium]|nr:phage resistance protein [Verrucomicrobiota bacterium]